MRSAAEKRTTTATQSASKRIHSANRVVLSGALAAALIPW